MVLPQLSKDARTRESTWHLPSLITLEDLVDCWAERVEDVGLLEVVGEDLFEPVMTVAVSHGV